MTTKLYKIERGIKVPPIAVNRTPSRPSAVALTIATLAKGDSFLIADEVAALKASKVIRDFNRQERERNGKRLLVTRKAGKGLRVWRVR